MVWIKNFLCKSCGSSLGKQVYNTDSEEFEDTCFCCELSDREIKEAEEEGEDYADLFFLLRKGIGRASELYPQINTPDLYSEVDISELSKHTFHEAYHTLTPALADLVEKLVRARKIHGKKRKRKK